MWRFSLVLLAMLSAMALSGCGQASSAPRPLTAEQERQLEEKNKQVQAEERLHQEKTRKAAAGSPRR